MEGVWGGDCGARVKHVFVVICVCRAYVLGLCLVSWVCALCVRVVCVCVASGVRRACLERASRVRRACIACAS